MSMYDDLEPPFVPAPDDSLSAVAARVHRLRTRRRLAIAASTAGSVLIAVLAGVAFASGGSSPHRLTVANSVTTTTHEGTTIAPSKREEGHRSESHDVDEGADHDRARLDDRPDGARSTHAVDVPAPRAPHRGVRPRPAGDAERHAQ